MVYPHQLAELSFQGIVAQIPSLIKSIQRKTITIAANASSGTEAINAVNMDKTICVPGNWYGADNGFYSASEDDVRVELTDATTLTAFTDSANTTEPRTAKVTVVEFQPWAVSNLVRDTWTIGSGNFGNSVSLPLTFDLDRAMPLHLGQTSSETGLEFGRARGVIAMPAGGTLTVLRGDSNTSTVTVSYEIIEFAPGIIKSAQTIAGQLGFGGAEATVSYNINAVNPNCTMLAWGGNSVKASSNDMRNLGRAELTDTDTVTLTREASTDTDCYVWFRVMEFYEKWIKNVQRGEDEIDAAFATEEDVAITPVDLDKAVAIYLGWGLNAFAANIDSATATVELIDSDTIRLQRYVGTNVADKVSWEVIEFR